MSNPFEGQLRALGIPMLSDRPGYGMATGRSGSRPAGGVTDELALAEEALRRKVHGPAAQPRTSPTTAAALRAPIPTGGSRLPEPFRERAAPTEDHRGADIFVGGFWDDLPIPGMGVMRDYADRYAEETGRPVRYFPNWRVGAVTKAIREANLGGGPVNVVGHSYGGPDAYNAAARAQRDGLHIDNLITLDPVGGPIGRVEGSEGADRWTNVYAAPQKPNRSDKITNTWFSDKPSKLPAGDADARVVVDSNHEDVGRMMRASGARRALDESRRLKPAATAGELHDDLKTPEWMRRREADVRAKRGY